ncbi:MAG: hypothetical protein NUV99_10095 [Clostridia bacterium]|nr:hypothetical protein [Clostridia bacterium]
MSPVLTAHQLTTGYDHQAAFPVGAANRRNPELAARLVSEGRKVFSLRSREEAEDLCGGAVASRLVYCRSREVVGALRHELAGRRAE